MKDASNISSDSNNNETGNQLIDYRKVLADLDRERYRTALSAGATTKQHQPVRPRGYTPKMIYDSADLAQSAVFSASISQAAEHIKLIDVKYNWLAKRKYSYENITQALANDNMNGDFLLEVLLKRGHVDVNCCNEFGFTLLHWACSRQFPLFRTRSVELLVGKGANIHAVDAKCGRTSLHCAAKSGDWESVDLLLRKGANWNVQERRALDGSNNGQTPLHLTAESGNVSLKAAGLLIKSSRGLAVKLVNLRGETPLHTAAVYNRVDVAKIILHAVQGANERFEYINKRSKVDDGETALMLARKHHSHHMIKFLTTELAKIRNSMAFSQQDATKIISSTRSTNNNNNIIIGSRGQQNNIMPTPASVGRSRSTNNNNNNNDKVMTASASSTPSFLPAVKH